jgi:hypothetical protein
MTRCLTAVLALLVAANAAAALLPDGACAVVKKAVARRDGLPESGPPGLGWFCDVTPDREARLFIVALRSTRPTPYSNLMGWYAVDRVSGELFRWDPDRRRTHPFAGPDR